ncbi:MAG: hypothetical protein WCE68_16085 [Anaerolineales bacterium]
MDKIPIDFSIRYFFPAGTYGFTQGSLPFTVTGAYTRLVVNLEYTGAKGMAWFDDASLLWAP